MFNNLDIYLVKDRLTRNLKTQFEATSQESLPPVDRKFSDAPETGREKRAGLKHRAWNYKPNRPEPDQN